MGCAGTKAPFTAKGNADASGTWTWTSTGRNNETRTTTLNLAREGDQLTGTIVRRSGRETPIEEGLVQDNMVSFKVTYQRNDRTFTVKYRGELIGDTIKGQIEYGRRRRTRTRDWEAYRKPSE